MSKWNDAASLTQCRGFIKNDVLKEVLKPYDTLPERSRLVKPLLFDQLLAYSFTFERKEEVLAKFTYGGKLLEKAPEVHEWFWYVFHFVTTKLMSYLSQPAAEKNVLELGWVDDMINSLNMRSKGKDAPKFAIRTYWTSTAKPEIIKIMMLTHAEAQKMFYSELKSLFANPNFMASFSTNLLATRGIRSTDELYKIIFENTDNVIKTTEKLAQNMYSQETYRNEAFKNIIKGYKWVMRSLCLSSVELGNARYHVREAFQISLEDFKACMDMQEVDRAGFYKQELRAIKIQALASLIAPHDPPITQEMFEPKSSEDMQLLAGFRFIREVFLDVYYGHHSGARPLARNPSVEWLAEVLHYNNIADGVKPLYTRLSAFNVVERNGNISVVIEVNGKTHALMEKNIDGDISDCLSENVRKAVGMYPLGSSKTLFGNLVEHLRVLKGLKRKPNAWEASMWLVLLMTVTMAVVTNKNLGKDDRSNRANNNAWWQAFYEMRKRPSRGSDAIKVKDNYQLEESPLHEVYQDARFMFNEGIVQLMVTSSANDFGTPVIDEEILFGEEPTESVPLEDYSVQDVEMIITEPAASVPEPQGKLKARGSFLSNLQMTPLAFLGKSVVSSQPPKPVTVSEEIPPAALQSTARELENVPKNVQRADAPPKSAIVPSKNVLPSQKTVVVFPPKSAVITPPKAAVPPVSASSSSSLAPVSRDQPPRHKTDR